ncbi:unnamed protein product [Paramecium sonneborni]|uniref:Tetratricopeptide repeat protein n=1 Tax=Paramecium sonneborni TaxID=65129 RepID=A0A8S1L8A0_9CILI|nr:unnamed protein product [Paramecium sonneborni]
MVQIPKKKQGYTWKCHQSIRDKNGDVVLKIEKNEQEFHKKKRLIRIIYRKYLQIQDYELRQYIFQNQYPFLFKQKFIYQFILEMDQSQSNQQENQVNTQSQQIQYQQQQDQVKQIKKDKEKCLEIKNKAGSLFNEQKFKEAALIYKEALNYCPLEDLNMLCILNSNIAICLLNQSEFESAIQQCSKALEFNPEFVKALYNRAECYEKTNQLEEALDDYKKLRGLQPKDYFIQKKFIDLDLKVSEFVEKRKNDAMKKIKNQQLLGQLGINQDNVKLEQNADGTFNFSFSQQ